MGCWNGTCGVSQLPIEAGDPVRAFLIGVRTKVRGDQSGYCESTGYGWPMSLPFKATYNDYGGVKNIQEDWNTGLIQVHFGFTESFEDWINDTIERDELTQWKRYAPIKQSDVTQDPEDTEVFDYSSLDYEYGVGLWMVHESVYQAMLSTVYQEYGGDPEDILAIALEEGQYFFEFWDQFFDNPENEDLSLRNLLKYYLWTGNPEMKKHSSRYGRQENQFGWAIKSLGPGSVEVGHAMEPYRKYIEGVYQGGGRSKDPLVQSFLQAVAEFQQFYVSMSLLRRGWVPQTGKGSQARQFHSHLKVLEAAAAIAKAKAKADEEEE